VIESKRGGGGDIPNAMESRHKNLTPWSAKANTNSGNSLT
jgi:transcriptional regulator CtsR